MNAFRFIDLFAGIGGFRVAFQNVGGKCVFSCDNDKFARHTYHANFGEIPYGDIRSIDKSDIPTHDVYVPASPVSHSPSQVFLKRTQWASLMALWTQRKELYF